MILKRSRKATRILKQNKNLWFFLAAYFLVLFNYPLIRAASTTFFFEAYGAKSSPTALFISVFFLSFSIWACSYLQVRSTAQKVFALASVLSSLLFLSGLFGLPYVSFIWKEIYIVIQVHLLLAYANVYFSKEDFKSLVGPIGAVGSIGGILGGLLTSYISSSWGGTRTVMIMGVVCTTLPAIFFLLTDTLKFEKKTERKVSPLKSLSDSNVRNYVLMIASIVVLTQFIINIFDFKFNIAFETAIPDSTEKTTYLGHLYTLTNALTLGLQLLVVPFLLKKISEKNYHVFIPLSFFLCLGIILIPGFPILTIAAVYIYVKAADYSLFSSGKEILYQPLSPEQKYGAKYLTDMLVYRAGKALIAAVLIYIQSSTILNIMIFGFLTLWVIQVLRLFKAQKTSLYRGSHEQPVT